MIETTVYVRCSRNELYKRLRTVPSAVKRRVDVPDAVGRSVLSRVEQAFLVKSRGGTDESGLRWAVLAPSTALKKLRKKNRTTENLRPSAALSAAQREQWWAYYRRSLARHHDKAIAARIAWTRLKQFGGALPFDKYALVLSTNILRDTDALLNSFTVGAADNVFDVVEGRADVGTRRKGASAHHKGAPGLPQRRLWPAPKDWASTWWRGFLAAAVPGVVKTIVEVVK